MMLLTPKLLGVAYGVRKLNLDEKYQRDFLRGDSFTVAVSRVFGTSVVATALADLFKG